MNAVIEKLAAWGCDTKGAMARMADDEEFYLYCLTEVAKDPAFEQLGQALTDGNKAQAFDCAHTLKGVLANVGLTPLYEKTTEIVEPLRRGESDGLNGKLGELYQMRDRLLQILG